MKYKPGNTKKRIPAGIISVLMTGLMCMTCGCGGAGSGTAATDEVPGTSAPEPTPERKYTMMQLFDDFDYRNGFTVIGQNTVKRGNVYLDPERPEGGEEKPSWMIAQWNSGPCLYRDRVETAQNILSDGSVKTVTFDPADRSVALRLNTFPIYNGAPGKTDKWPHLLLEQSPLDFNPAKSVDSEKAPYYCCSADRMEVELDIRMNSYRHEEIEGVNAAQFLSYYYLKSVTGDDFIWFGVPLFDNRGETQIYWAVDTAGSDRMIYSIASTDTYKNSPHSLLNASGEPIVSDEWIHVKVDLKPHLEAVLNRALSDGKLKYAKSLDELYISGVNIGWETIGSFDAEIQIRDFKLCSYVEDDGQ